MSFENVEVLNFSLILPRFYINWSGTILRVVIICSPFLVNLVLIYDDI